MWSVLLYCVKILHTWSAVNYFISDYLNAFLQSSKVTVQAAVLGDLLCSEILFLSPAEIVDKLSFPSFIFKRPTRTQLF